MPRSSSTRSSTRTRWLVDNAAGAFPCGLSSEIWTAYSCGPCGRTFTWLMRADLPAPAEPALIVERVVGPARRRRCEGGCWHHPDPPVSRLQVDDKSAVFFSHRTGR